MFDPKAYIAKKSLGTETFLPQKYLASKDVTQVNPTPTYSGPTSTTWPVAFGRGLERGATLGLSDLAQAIDKSLGVSVIPPKIEKGMPFSEALQSVRNQRLMEQAEHPVATTLGTAGSYVGGLPAVGFKLLRNVGAKTIPEGLGSAGRFMTTVMEPAAATAALSEGGREAITGTPIPEAAKKGLEQGTVAALATPALGAVGAGALKLLKPIYSGLYGIPWEALQYWIRPPKGSTGMLQEMAGKNAIENLGAELASKAGWQNFPEYQQAMAAVSKIPQVQSEGVKQVLSDVVKRGAETPEQEAAIATLKKWLNKYIPKQESEMPFVGEFKMGEFGPEVNFLPPELATGSVVTDILGTTKGIPGKSAEHLKKLLQESVKESYGKEGSTLYEKTIRKAAQELRNEIGQASQFTPGAEEYPTLMKQVAKKTGAAEGINKKLGREIGAKETVATRKLATAGNANTQSKEFLKALQVFDKTFGTDFAPRAEAYKAATMLGRGEPSSAPSLYPRYWTGAIAPATALGLLAGAKALPLAALASPRVGGELIKAGQLGLPKLRLTVPTGAFNIEEWLRKKVEERAPK